MYRLRRLPATTIRCFARAQVFLLLWGSRGAARDGLPGYTGLRPGLMRYGGSRGPNHRSNRKPQGFSKRLTDGTAEGGVSRGVLTGRSGSEVTGQRRKRSKKLHYTELIPARNTHTISHLWTRNAYRISRKLIPSPEIWDMRVKAPRLATLDTPDYDIKYRLLYIMRDYQSLNRVTSSLARMPRRYLAKVCTPG